jgi:hypothetical protein
LSELTPDSNGTNYTMDFAFSDRVESMTNHVHFNALNNASSDGQVKPWTCRVKNYSGSTFNLSVAASMKRAGTNWVNVPNGAEALVQAVSYGNQVSNTLASITLFDSP